MPVGVRSKTWLGVIAVKGQSVKTIFKHPCAVCGEHDFAFHDDLHQCTQYQWVCECGAEMRLRFFDGGQSVEQTPTGRRCDRTLALLRVRGVPHLMFIYSGCAWDGDLSGHAYYYYNQHTCPSNLMQCEEIIDSGEVDPHGVFEFVAEHFVTGPKGRPKDNVLEELTELAQRMTLTPNV